MKLLVIFEHQTKGTHDEAATASIASNGDLLITNPDKTTVTYPDGTWSGHGVGIVCAFHTPDPACPRCHSQG